MNKENKILNKEWTELSKGTVIGKHPFHTFNLSSVSGNTPNARTVVLRKVSSKNNEISFHTDFRSSKFNEISLNNNVCALFYDKKRKVQLRITGSAYIEHDTSSSQKSWKNMTNESKICYMGPYAPSSFLKEFKPNLPKILPHQIKLENEKFGYMNFCVVNIIISRIDWLSLDHKGHKRILFYLGANIKSNWIAS